MPFLSAYRFQFARPEKPLFFHRFSGAVRPVSRCGAAYMEDPSYRQQLFSKLLQIHEKAMTVPLRDTSKSRAGSGFWMISVKTAAPPACMLYVEALPNKRSSDSQKTAENRKKFKESGQKENL